MSHGDWIELARLGLELLGGICAVALTVLGVAHRSLLREMATKAELAKFKIEHGAEHDDLVKRLAEGESRFGRIEILLAAMPTKDEVSSLTVQMERLRGDIRVAAAILDRVEQPVRAITEGALAEMTKNG